MLVLSDNCLCVACTSTAAYTVTSYEGVTWMHGDQMVLQACTSEPRPLFYDCKQVGVAQIERDQHAVARVSAAVPVRLHLQGK